MLHINAAVFKRGNARRPPCVGFWRAVSLGSEVAVHVNDEHVGEHLTIFSDLGADDTLVDEAGEDATTLVLGLPVVHRHDVEVAPEVELALSLIHI